jgi:hypothetical protein
MDAIAKKEYGYQANGRGKLTGPTISTPETEPLPYVTANGSPVFVPHVGGTRFGAFAPACMWEK